MRNSQPQPLTPKDWREIGAIPAIRESWGVGDGEDFMNVADGIYAVKFDFVSGSPGYVGELFILHGDALMDVAPFVVKRDGQGALVVV